MVKKRFRHHQTGHNSQRF